MKNFINKHYRFIFYSCWLILALIQSRYTELLDDEAYYWVYSHYLAWGYFDHPPMIALMIKAGYFIFPNELGVRLIAVLMNLFSILIIEKLVSNKNSFLFYIIILSISVLQLGGFLAVPDTPLIFFTALFFWRYKLFSENQSWRNIIWLAVVSILLLYSKYHGILIIFFTLLSDLSLLRKWKTYVIALIIFTGLLPHLYWQFIHGWPSVQYHLFERNAQSYKLAYTFEYIIGQVLLPGPLAGIILVPAAFLYKATNKTEKAHFISMLGFYLFFLISTLRGRVEANWTAPVIVPLVVLSYAYLSNQKKWVVILIRLLPFTLLLTVLARIAMIVDFIPLKFVKERYHSWESWPLKMKEQTKNLPVVFNNSYQNASKYWFYSGQVAYSPSAYYGRRTNFDFWPIEDSLLGKKVYILDTYNLQNFQDSLSTPIGYVGFNYDPYYISLSKIQFKPDVEKIKILSNNPGLLQGKIDIPEDYLKYINSSTFKNLTIKIGIFSRKEWIKDIPVQLFLNDFLSGSFKISFTPDLPAGSYFLLFSIQNGNNIPTHNSQKVSLLIH